jgi:FtsP/CotA-like multicopper oxidase with cupredoxin domain
MRLAAFPRVFRPLAAAALLLHPVSSGSQESGAGEVRLRAEIRDGALVAETDTARVREGQTVTITWTADRPTELHLHGYDLGVTAKPEEPGVMRFEASIPGRFPVEVHASDGGHAVVLYVEVLPR